MQLALVVGQAVSTVKHASLTGWRLLIVQPLTAHNKEDGEPILAIDYLGAGDSDRVIVSNDGSGAARISEIEDIARSLVRDGNYRSMNGNGKAGPRWGYAIEGRPVPMLLAALNSLVREGACPEALADCNGDSCSWVRDVAQCLKSNRCGTSILFCEDPGLACCVANKVPGVRAATVSTLAEARRALEQLGANLMVVETRGRTYYEFRSLLRLCCTERDKNCPPAVAKILQELDGHAHR